MINEFQYNHIFFIRFSYNFIKCCLSGQQPIFDKILIMYLLFLNPDYPNFAIFWSGYWIFGRWNAIKSSESIWQWGWSYLLLHSLFAGGMERGIRQGIEILFFMDCKAGWLQRVIIVIGPRVGGIDFQVMGIEGFRCVGNVLWMDVKRQDSEPFYDGPNSSD